MCDGLHTKFIRIKFPFSMESIFDQIKPKWKCNFTGNILMQTNANTRTAIPSWMWDSYYWCLHLYLFIFSSIIRTTNPRSLCVHHKYLLKNVMQSMYCSLNYCIRSTGSIGMRSTATYFPFALLCNSNNTLFECNVWWYFLFALVAYR